MSATKHPITGAWLFSTIHGGHLVRLQWYGSKRAGLRAFRAMLRGEGSP